MDKPSNRTLIWAYHRHSRLNRKSSQKVDIPAFPMPICLSSRSEVDKFRARLFQQSMFDWTFIDHLYCNHDLFFITSWQFHFPNIYCSFCNGNMISCQYFHPDFKPATVPVTSRVTHKSRYKFYLLNYLLTSSQFKATTLVVCTTRFLPLYHLTVATTGRRNESLTSSDEGLG